MRSIIFFSVVFSFACASMPPSTDDFHLRYLEQGDGIFEQHVYYSLSGRIGYSIFSDAVSWKTPNLEERDRLKNAIDSLCDPSARFGSFSKPKRFHVDYVEISCGGSKPVYVELDYGADDVEGSLRAIDSVFSKRFSRYVTVVSK